MKKVCFVFLILLCGCSSRTDTSNELMSMQLIDRNGFSETISSKDRLSVFENSDFLSQQPYQKVLRVYGHGSEIVSKITSYHSNGEPWQYLEVIDGRAHGEFREWHPNGKLKLEATVIEGTPDITEAAQMSWLFNGKCHVWDEEGGLTAEITYEKGLLEGEAFYYHPNAQLSQRIPYHKDEIDGTLDVFSSEGALMEKMEYIKGLRQGMSIGYWERGNVCYEELYQKGLLSKGNYYDQNGFSLSEIREGKGKQTLFKDGLLFSTVEFQSGAPEGEVMIFNEDGCLASSYSMKNSMKNGDEWEYYPKRNGAPQPKLCLHWRDDVIQGVVKTWYENGMLESQREMNGNKKHGLCFAWFREGDLMLMEEYEDDTLVKGSYFKKWEKKPISKVENGKGIATLHDSDGHFLKKIVYEKGLPQNESSY